MSWFDEAVFYHIYPLGLLDAPKENKEGAEADRMEELGSFIPHMKELGFSALYIGPLFESVGHGYETTDYKKVDRRIGDNKGFKEFVHKCHEEGIKVVVDGVFNHTGREFFAFLDIKQNREQSRYKNWYCNLNFGGNNEYNDGFSYEAWRGHNVLVKLNLKNPEVKNYLFDVIRYWAEEFDIDGIRLDCADVLDFDFMKEMRAFCKGISEDFWLMGEVIHGDYSRWVSPQMLHSVTDYELHKGLYSGHNDHNYFEIAHTVKRLFDPNGGICKGCNLYSFIDNHDVERIINKLNKREHIVPVTILLYALPGIPSIYYGSEFLIEGKKERHSDESLRPPLKLEDYMDEGKAVNGQNAYKAEYQNYIKLLSDLGKLRKKSKALAYGNYMELKLMNRQYAFARIYEKEVIIAAVNNDEKEAAMTITLPQPAKTAVNIITGEEIAISGNSMEIVIGASNGCIFELRSN